MKFNYISLRGDNLEDYTSCFSENGGTKNKQNIIWQFFKNKLPNDFTIIARDDAKQRTAGIYAISTVVFQIGNKDFLAAQSLDTITDINYRGKGLFTHLANLVYEKGKQEKLELVYGFPNGNSIHGFTKKLEWENHDPLPFLIKPLNTKYFSSKISYLRWIPNLKLPLLERKINYKYRLLEDFSFSEDVNQVWAIFSKHFSVSIKRDQSYLTWRYLQKPNENYRIIHSYDEDNKYIGFVVFCVKEKHNGKIGYIMELIYDPLIPRVGEELLGFAVKQIKKDEADVILSWCFSFSPNYKSYKKNGFFKIPEKLKPIELHFGYRLLSSTNAKLLSKRENWYLSYSDSDTV